MNLVFVIYIFMTYDIFVHHEIKIYFTYLHYLICSIISPYFEIIKQILI